MPLNMRCALSTIRPDVISVISIQAGEIFELQLQKIPIEQRGKNCCFRKIITRKGITLFEVHCVLVCRLRNRGSELQLKCVKGKMLVFFFSFSAIWRKQWLFQDILLMHLKDYHQKIMSRTRDACIHSVDAEYSWVFLRHLKLKPTVWWTSLWFSK